MAYSKIVLTFTRAIVPDETIEFRWEDTDSGVILDTIETAKDKRLANFEFYAGGGGLRYNQAFEIDWNGTHNFDISISGNVVTIEGVRDNIEFSNFYSTAGVTAVITNETPIPLFEISSIGFSTDSGSPNNNVSVNVTTNTTVTNVTSPVTISGNPDNTVSFDYARGSVFLLEVNNGVSFVSQYVTTPAFLPIPSVTKVATPTGANITINPNTTELTVTYSLDGTNYQSSNIFSGLIADDYIAYTKDQYGSVRSIAFSVDEFTPELNPTSPVVFISNTNSIRFKKDVIWNNINIFKNNQNTLACEEDVILNYPYIQKYLSSDVITTQFKTNYSNISIKTIEKDGTETVIIPVKKTTNIGNKDKRDGIKYDFGDGRNGVYFTIGNTYDYDTEDVTGSYDLSGDVPDWAEIGNYFDIGLVYYKIIDIVFVKAINANVLVINSTFATFGSAKIGAIYNIFDYEVYEFTLLMGEYIDRPFSISIRFTDSTFTEVRTLSEAINIFDDLSNMIEVKATSTENNEILYTTGIIHKLHLDYALFSLAGENEIEIHKTDNSVYQLNAKKYPKKELQLMYLSTMMVEKVSQIFSLNVITIDGLKYTTESIDTPKRLGVSNYYEVTIKLFEIGVSADSEKDPFLASSGDFSSTGELDSTFLLD